MTSPYSDLGPKLVDQGYSAIPVLPGTKRPGAFSSGRWFGDLDWQRYCDRLPTEHETPHWARWPDAGICLALGKASGGVVAMDIDTDNGPMQRAIESVLPVSPVQKAGRKGYTSFYRASPAVVSRAFNVGGERVLDLLAHGKQTILPPTIHPDTGKPYYWLTADTLEHVAPEALPVVPDNIADLLAEALATFGYIAPVERAAVAGGESDLFREVNDRALDRLDSWVPELGIEAKRSHNGNWRGKAIWKGATNANVSFSPQGIKDFGEELGMTAIDAVMMAHNSDFATAEKWLRGKLGFREPPPVRILLKPKMKAEPVVERIEAAPIYAPESKADPFAPGAPGGLMSKVTEWILSTSIRPSPELATLASIAFMSVFAGRRYVGPTGLGCNLYLMGVAGPGVGKNAPLSAVKTLIFGAGVPWLYGSGNPASDSAMERTIRRSPSCLFAIDEIGITLQEMSGKMAAPYQQAKRRSLLELYSVSGSGGIWTGKDRAGAETESSVEPVHSPCASVLGMSTQTEFYKGVTESNLRDGLVARLMVIEAKGRGEQQDVDPIVRIPHSLTGAIKDAGEAWPVKGNMAAPAARNATATPTMHAVDWASPEVKAMWKKYCGWAESVILDDESQAGIIGRAGEQSLKLACLRAISRDAGKPLICAADMEWAQALVNLSVETIQRGIKQYMHGSEFEELWKCMLQHVTRFGDKGLSNSALIKCKGVSKADGNKVKSATEFLSKAGLWVQRKSGKGMKYFAATAEEIAAGDGD